MSDDVSARSGQGGDNGLTDERGEYLTSLAQRAADVFTDRPIAAAVLKVRAIVGVPKIPDAEAAAQSAWDKLRNNTRPNAAELAALELVIRLMRPAPLSIRGELTALPSLTGSSTYNPLTNTRWEGFRQRVKPFLYSIGRLDRASGRDPEVGTGFLIAPNLVLTNRHVAGQLSYGAEALDPGQATISFNQEADTVDPEESRFPINSVVALHPRLDLALLGIALPTPRPICSLDTGTLTSGVEVAAIGYPYKDGRDPLFVPAVFGGKFGVKRAALGQITSVHPEQLTHDCSTLGGNSGSPIFSLTSGKVVGVHYTGQFMYRNLAIPAADVAAFITAAAQR